MTSASGKRRPWWRAPLLRLLTVVAPVILSGALRMLSWTLRLDIVGADDLFRRWSNGEKVIVAFWHSRLLFMPMAARGRPVCIMVSEHRDGEIASRALARWGIHTVRGSATRGGARGFLRLVAAYRSGDSLAVVPDGPQGPRHKAKPGVIHLAKITGAVIVPVSAAASQARCLGSWDRMLIPLPFARVVLIAGEPLVVSRDADDNEVEQLRRILEDRLNELGRAAEQRLAA
jgi:hypothetical protein